MKGARVAGWIIGLGGVVACTATVAVAFALGLATVHVLFYPTFIAAGVLGSLITSRQPRNGVGWIMSIASLGAVLFYLPVEYGYAALVLHPGAWPLGALALWFGAWAWAPLLGLFIPMLTVRFPDGTAPHRWRAVDALAVAGTTVFATGIALAPPAMNARFLQVPPAARLALGGAAPHSPVPVSVAAGQADVLIATGVVLMLIAYLVAVISVIERLRHATEERRLQIKWFAYAGIAVIGAQVLGAAALVMGWDLGPDLDTAVHLLPLALPVAVAIAILHRRLYDIDLLINRTLVYGGLTAVLAASYTAGITLLQRMYVAASGEKSDAVYVLTAFGIVVGFTPLKNWLQGWVDRHIGARGPATLMRQLSAEVDTVVSVIDVEKIARRFLDQAVAAYSARGAVIHLESDKTHAPLYSVGVIEFEGNGSIDVPLRCDGRRLGSVHLGRRRGGAAYTRSDCEALQRSADSIGEALVLAEHLGFVPRPVNRMIDALHPSNDSRDGSTAAGDSLRGGTRCP